MPYEIQKRGNKFVVVKKDDGQVMGSHDSDNEAKAQIAAIHISEAKKK